MNKEIELNKDNNLKPTHLKLKIFSDFDGTISVEDLGDKLFKTFGEWDKHWTDFKNGRVGVRELNIRLCNSLDPKITIEDISKFASEQTIDPYFLKFVDFCDEHSIKITIVSDGYGEYIKPFLSAHSIEGLVVYSNSLVLRDNVYQPSFFDAVEYVDNICKDCLTASCKRNVVINNSSDEDIVVFIGDGHTDFCAAEHSDIIFAKLNLAAYCNKYRLPHYTYNTFFDVYRTLKKIIEEKNFRIRHQAMLKRKAAFRTE